MSKAISVSQLDVGTLCRVECLKYFWYLYKTTWPNSSYQEFDKDENVSHFMMVPGDYPNPCRSHVFYNLFFFNLKNLEEQDPALFKILEEGELFFKADTPVFLLKKVPILENIDLLPRDLKTVIDQVVLMINERTFRVKLMYSQWYLRYYF